MKFKQFINEAAIGKHPKYKPHDLDKAVDLFFTNCKDALWMIEKNTPLYRGDRSLKNLTEIHTVNPTLTERKSQNTKNHYTVLMDNLPSWKGWPKRSRSLICTTDWEYAFNFNDKPAFRLIPFDGAKIGVCPEHDLWFVPVFKNKTFQFIPTLLQACGMPSNVTSWESFTDFDRDLQNSKSNKLDFNRACKNYQLLPEITNKLSESFLSTLNDEMNPKKLMFQKHTTKTLASTDMNQHRETWVGGRCMLIPDKVWIAFRTAVLERAK